MPSQPQPHDPTVEHYRHQARHLHRGLRDGSTVAAARVARHLSRLRDAADADVLAADVGLQECQHVVARENGYTGWSGLVDPGACRFEDIVRLSDADIAVLVREVGPQDLALALAGLLDAPVSRRHQAVFGMLRQLPEEMHEQLRARTQSLTPDLDAVAGAQQRIAAQVAQLQERGHLRVGPERSAPVERRPAPDLALDWADRLETAAEDDVRGGLQQLASAHERGQLEASVPESADGFVWHGVRFVVDGTPAPLVRHILDKRMWSILRSLETRWRMAVEATASIAWDDNPRWIQQKLTALYTTDGPPALREVEGTVPQALERLRRTPATRMSHDAITALYADLSWIARVASAVRADGLAVLGQIAAAIDDPLMAAGLRLLVERVGRLRPADDELGRVIEGIVDELEQQIPRRLARVRLRHQLALEGLSAIAEGRSSVDVAALLQQVRVEDELRTFTK